MRGENVETNKIKTNEIDTTEKYWDCECKENYIHPNSQKVCFKCNTVATDQPDSRVDEVLSQGLHL